MSSLGEMIRPETDRHPGTRPSDRAVLRGAARPDLIRDEVLGDVFAATVRARPNHPALIDGSVTDESGRHPHLTYAEVFARAGRIAAGLAHRGIGPGDVVGLWMARGPDLLVAQIGITRSGAAWLPFDAEAPADRVAVCLSDADAKALLVSPALAPDAPAVAPAWTPDALLAETPADAAAPDLRAAGLTPRAPRLSDLHLRLDRRAQGHRHQPRQHLPLPALGERALRDRRPTTSCSRAPPSPSISRWRRSGFPTSSARRCSSRRPTMIGDVGRLPGHHRRRQRHGARYRADAARA